MSFIKTDYYHESNDETYPMWTLTDAGKYQIRSARYGDVCSSVRIIYDTNDDKDWITFIFYFRISIDWGNGFPEDEISIDYKFNNDKLIAIIGSHGNSLPDYKLPKKLIPLFNKICEIFCSDETNQSSSSIRNLCNRPTMITDKCL